MIDGLGDDAAGQPLATVRDVLSEAQRRLAAAGVASPGNDAITLLCHVLQVPRTRLLLGERITVADRVRFERLLMRRCARVPLQHLTGTAPFRRLEVRVGPGVFVPRPETEVVAQAAIDHLLAQPLPDRIAVDLCSGSGAIALALATEVPGSLVHAVELDPAAATWTQRNLDACAAQIAGVGSSVHLHVADAGTCAAPGGLLAHLAGEVRVVVANPPYIPLDAVPVDPEVREHDPARALFGGADGLDVVRAISTTAAVLLRAGGLFVVEHADVQGEQVVEILAAEQVRGHAAWADCRDHRDLTRRPRFATATRTAAR